MNDKIGLRIVSALILIAAIAGIGFFAFRAGVSQGSPITIEAPAGQSVPAPYPYYGYGMPFHRPFGFGYGFCSWSSRHCGPSASSSGVRAGDTWVITVVVTDHGVGTGRTASRPCLRNGTKKHITSLEGMGSNLKKRKNKTV
jgi:hypothetical protein